MAARSGVRRAASVLGGEPVDASLEGAREAVADLRWLDAFRALSALDGESGLTPEDLELLATAAFLLGRSQECRQARLRAYQLYLHRGDARPAARCAARIGLEQLGAGEVAEAAGCLPVSVSACSAWAAQAAALVQHEPEAPEHGYVVVTAAYERLATAGHPEEVAEAAARAVAYGRRCADADLLAMALMVQGRALVRWARVSEAMAVLEESVTLAGSGATSPPVAGLALSAAVAASEEAFELSRCDEWIATLARWCDRQGGMVTFKCRSLATQAVMRRRHGRWATALEVAEEACASPIAELDPPAAAAARCTQGDVMRLRGELQAADVAYRQAAVLGLDPQPGLALLRLAEGDVASALGSLDRAIAEAQHPLRRARMLPARVDVLLAGGKLAAAADAARELELIARDHPTAVLEATARHATAAVRLAEGDASAALAPARQACRVWRHFDLPYEEAQTRLLIATCCGLLGDDATADLERATARDTLAALGAKLALEQPTSPVAPLAPPAHGLTRREREVLALVATGLTNRAIAQRLHLTTRTVDTHVSRILTKLGVATRTAATAFAHRHGLV
jgi:DNA-binding CsgD family transcriptional regulator